MIRPVLSTISMMVNTDPIEADFELSTFPNPFTHTIWVERNNETPIQLSIVDMNGKIIMEEEIYKKIHQIESLELLPAGTYLLQVEGEAIRKSIPIVKVE